KAGAEAEDQVADRGATQAAPAFRPAPDAEPIPDALAGFVVGRPPRAAAAPPASSDADALPHAPVAWGAAAAGGPEGARGMHPHPEPEAPAQPVRGKPEGGVRGSDLGTVPVRVPAAAPVLPFDGSHRRAAEQYRLVRTKIVQHPGQPRMLVVSSPAPGDGKTVTAVNIAGALALKNDANVLLMDGDLRRSTI